VTVENGAKVLHYESSQGSGTVAVDDILVGAGRVPNVDGLDLEKVGVEYDRRGVNVNDNLQTSNPAIYAAGDIAMNYKFTHAADAAARIVVQNALFLGRKKLSALTMPWCTYTDPEIAHVGLYEHQAREQGIEVDTYTAPLEDVDRAIADGEDEGFVKVHVKKGSDKILGATIVASHAGEMISEITLAMEGNIGLGAINNIIHPYPTQAEAIRKAASAYSRTRLTPTVQRLFGLWLRLTR
jgi:pyruvate/2-oxoglutarate dehydrogenase complex dihydrolipoamide dehydrogenase (E3) component